MSQARWNGGLVATGAAGIVVTSGLYGAAPELAALPHAPLQLAEVGAATVEGASLLKAAGGVGLAGDVVLIAGALLVMVAALRSERTRAAAGWAFVALATLVFIGVDALAAGVLPQLAQSPAQFEGPRRLFDVFWVLGTATFGIGGLLTVDRAVLRQAPVAAWMARVAAGVAVGSTLAFLVGVPSGLVMGLSIGFGAAAFAGLGARMAQGRLTA
ncbi:MAG: hypothetical protein Q8L14_26595 [Myxococcales bacterium]|nr:hypothetical protein [Myxococcales bacterium]